MKLDKIKFARLMNVLSRWGLHELGEADIREIDDIIDIGPDSQLIARIKQALGTNADGDALVEVARDAYRNSEELASHYYSASCKP